MSFSITAIVSEAKSPDGDAMKEELCETVRRAIKCLPLSTRQLIERHHIHGQSIHEAALAMGIPPGAAKTRLHRARKELRENLERAGVA